MEIAQTDVPCVEIREQRGEAFQIGRIRVRDDVGISGRADHAAGVDGEAAVE